MTNWRETFAVKIASASSVYLHFKGMNVGENTEESMVAAYADQKYDRIVKTIRAAVGDRLQIPKYEFDEYWGSGFYLFLKGEKQDLRLAVRALRVNNPRPDTIEYDEQDNA